MAPLPTLRFSKPLAGRAVYIQVVPRPKNIAERREVFRLLSKFGELQYYKSQVYDTTPKYNGAFVIFKDEEVARHVIQTSPISFRMGIERDQTQTRRGQQQQQANSFLKDTTNSVHSPRVRTAASNDLPEAPPQSPILPSDDPINASLPKTSELYQITANPPAADLKNLIEMGPYHGNFVPKQDDISFEDLAKRVPARSMAAIDWRLPTLRMSTIVASREREKKNKLDMEPLSSYRAKYLAAQEETETMPD